MGLAIVAHDITAALLDGSFDGTTSTPDHAGRMVCPNRPINGSSYWCLTRYARHRMVGVGVVVPAYFVAIFV
jgi:hypothetical protein